MRGKLPSQSVPDEDRESRRGSWRVRLSVRDALDLGEVAHDERPAGARRAKLRDLKLIDRREVREVLLLCGSASIGALNLKPRREKALQPSLILVLEEDEEAVHQSARPCGPPRFCLQFFRARS